MYRARRSTSPCPAPRPASPDITYETTATATKRAPMARATATTMPAALFSGHLLQTKLSCAEYPSLQTLQSVRSGSGQQVIRGAFKQEAFSRGVLSKVLSTFRSEPINNRYRGIGKLTTPLCCTRGGEYHSMILSGRTVGTSQATKQQYCCSVSNYLPEVGQRLRSPVKTRLSNNVSQVFKGACISNHTSNSTRCTTRVVQYSM